MTVSKTFHSNNDPIDSNSSFVVGGNIEQYNADIEESFQLGFPTSDQGGSELEAFYPLHENSSSTAFDESSNSNDGSIDGVEINQSKLLEATHYLFESAFNDKVSVPDNSTLDFDLDDNHTVIAFVKTSDGGSEAILSKEDPDNNKKGWLFALFNGKVRFHHIDSSGNLVGKTGDTDISDGSWHMIAATYDGSGDASGISIFVDGSEDSISRTINDDAATDNSNSEKMFIGERNDGTINMNSNLGVSRLYRRHLSTTEISNRWPKNFDENVEFSEKSFSNSVDPTTLELRNPTINIPSNTQLKAKVHRTDSNGNIQESSDELDLSGSFPIEVTWPTSTSEGPHYKIELTTITTSDLDVSPTYTSIDLTVVNKISGSSGADNSGTNGLITTVSSISGSFKSKKSTSSGNITVVPTPIFGTVESKISNISASIITVSTISGEAKSSLSISDGNISPITSIKGRVDGKDSTLSSSLSLLLTISGVSNSTSSTSSGALDLIPLPISGKSKSEDSKLSGLLSVITSVSGTSTSKISSTLGDISLRFKTLPQTPKISKATFRLERSISRTQSPFTLKQKRTEHTGKMWQAELELPPIYDKIQRGRWRRFIVYLRDNIVFKMGDPTYTGAAGNPSGSPKFKDFGSNKRVLKTTGWDASVTNILREGDYISVKNELKMIKSDVSSDSSGNATLDVIPAFRQGLKSGDSINFKNPQGLFMLSNRDQEWNSEDFRLGLVFSVREFINI